MKSKIPFKFGEWVLVLDIPRRITLPDKSRIWYGRNGDPTNNKYGFCEPKKAIYLGYRNLYDGILDSEGTFEDYYTYLKVTKTHRAALICIKGHKPQYAFLADLEKINDSPNNNS